MTSDTVRLRDIAKGMIKSLPDSATINKGLFNLLNYSLRPERNDSIGLLIERLARQKPGNVALMFEGQRWTYAEFNAWANRIAQVLKANGLKPGQAVAIVMENRPEVLACVTAVIKLGGIAAMLNHNQRGEVLRHSINVTKIRMVIAGQECTEALQSASCDPKSDVERTYFWEGTQPCPPGFVDLRAATETADSGNPVETQTVALRQPAFYIFTSGTTGMPKASVMTHHRWMRGMAGLGQLVLRLKDSDIFYCTLPLYHNNALTVSWGSALGAGCALALGRKFSASKFWDEVRSYQATAFCYIGELCRYLLNQPENSLDRAHGIRVIVGNGLRPEIWDAFQKRFGIERISEFYGASESNLAFVNGFGLSKTAGYCPLPFAIVEFDAEAEAPVRGGDGHMRKVAKGGAGLLITEVSDRNPFDGYTDSKASAAKLFHDVFEKGDCWLNTGDLVRDQGYRHIQFVDRVGDTFRWKGENVATTEVEAALNRFPGMAEAVVYGVQIEGADGRGGMAAVTLAQGELPAVELARHLLAELPVYAVPLFIRVRQQQEITGTFKFRKVELKQDGFDLGKINEPIYVLADRQTGYVRLTPQIEKEIRSGQLRL